MSSAASPRIVVALDGPASSGKSSVGIAVAERLGLRFLDTGLIYRAITALALREHVAPEDQRAVITHSSRASNSRTTAMGAWTAS
ncbi:MAG: (d)CMP kinase [Chloroflexota bacterium]